MKVKIKELLSKGVGEVIEKESLLQKLNSKKKLRIKYGTDPTGPKIHLGRASVLWKLKAFQELGHQIVLIIGDFTAQIGDASDKESMRKALTELKVRENMKDYINQIGKILVIKKLEIHYNSEWLRKLSAKDLLKLAMKFTAQQMIQRRNFKERWDSNKPIGVHELLYPLFQGYDSVAVKADIEIGGYDQLFNLLVGREIQQMYGQKPQDIMVLKMLPGLDGEKMSTSRGNVINITEEPKEMYGKIMSMKDEMISDYFELSAPLLLKEIEKIKKLLERKKVNPRDLKAKLAREIVKIYHSEKEAIEAEKEFNLIFKAKKMPEKIPVFYAKKREYSICNLLFDSKLASSKSAAKRVIFQGGVKLDGKVEKDWQKKIKIKDELIIQIGKRKFIRIKTS